MRDSKSEKIDLRGKRSERTTFKLASTALLWLKILSDKNKIPQKEVLILAIEVMSRAIKRMDDDEFPERGEARLASINPARFIAGYHQFRYPIGTMRDGAMANLVVFDPNEGNTPDEAILADQLKDPHYHTAMRGEKLRGTTQFTVVDGRVYDVKSTIHSLN